MGRFETTASTYERYREPYPPEFFAAIADRLAVSGNERLIDLGTGPGVIALGMAPHVGSVLGVDPEPSMLSEAEANAARRGVALPLLAGRAEDLPAELGTFDIVTIGRALHWMDRPAALAVLDRILAKDGAILIIGTIAGTGEDNPWRGTMTEVLHSWNPDAHGRWDHVYNGWWDGSPFGEMEAILHPFQQPVTPDWLFKRALTRSSTSAAILGDRIEACREELLAALTPFFPEGERMETLVAKANVIRRR